MLLLLLALAAPDDWTQFRGPTGLGTTTETNLPERWNGKTGENVAWSSELVGEGHASPVVHGDRVFITTVRWPGGTPDKRIMPEHHVLCYGAADGKLLWDTPVEPGSWLRGDFRSGPGGGYAAPTPATDGTRVFVAWGSSVMAALDHEGKVVWRREIRPSTFDVTLGASPVLHGDTVILFCAMAKPADSRLVAFRKSDGEVAWETKMPTVRFGHSTPVIIEAGGRRQLIVNASGMKPARDSLQAFDPADGQRLWWCRAAGDASSPAWGAGILYVDSGRGGTGTAVDPTGSGDVSETHIRWTSPRLSECIGSPIIVGDHVFRLQNPGVLRVWSAKDGTETDKQRLDGIGSTWASPIADPKGRIWFASGGKSYVVQAGAQIKVLAVNDLGDSNHASPAASRARLFIAGLKRLWCLSRD